jgi:hypothetical protein
MNTPYRIGLCIEERNGPFKNRNLTTEEKAYVSARTFIFDEPSDNTYVVYGIHPEVRLSKCDTKPKFRKSEPYSFSFEDEDKLVKFLNIVIGNNEENISYVFFHYNPNELDDDSILLELEKGITSDYILSAYDDKKFDEKELREYISILTCYIL